MTNTFDPVPFVQRQLDAYNARDLDRFVREYTDDITAWRLPGAQPLLSGMAAFADHYRRHRSTCRACMRRWSIAWCSATR